MATPTQEDYSFYVSIIAAVVSFMAITISVYVQYITSRKTNYINTITSERIRWLERVRNTVSDLYSSAYWLSTKPRHMRSSKDLSEIDKKIGLIELLLSPSEENKSYIELLDKIRAYFRLSESEEMARDVINRALDYPLERENMRNNIDELKKQTRMMLKNEWNRIKEEAGEIKPDYNFNAELVKLDKKP